MLSQPTFLTYNVDWLVKDSPTTVDEIFFQRIFSPQSGSCQRKVLLKVHEPQWFLNVEKVLHVPIRLHGIQKLLERSITEI